MVCLIVIFFLSILLKKVKFLKLVTICIDNNTKIISKNILNKKFLEINFFSFFIINKKPLL